MAPVPAAGRLTRALLVVACVLALAGGALATVGQEGAPPPAGPAGPTGPTGQSGPTGPTLQQAALGPAEPAYPRHPSRALGRPNAGRLLGGVQLPAEGDDYITWDPVLKRTPDRAWRRWGTDRLIRQVLGVLRGYRAAHPEAPRVLIGDLSRPHGGAFGARFGGHGHASHQNGLDADVYYPRRDGLPLAAVRPSQIDHAAAAELLRRFLASGVKFVFVGTRTGLRGPRRIVQVLPLHNDHMHVRIRP